MPGEDSYDPLSEMRTRLVEAGCEVIEPSGIEHEATRRWNGALRVQPALEVRCDTAAKLSSARPPLAAASRLGNSIGSLGTGNIIFPWADAQKALAKFTELMLHAPAELFGAAILSEGPGRMPVIVISLVWTGELEAGKTIAAELATIGKPVVVKIEPMQASKILSLTDGKLAQGRGYEVATRWFRTLEPETIRALITAFEARTSSTSSIIIHHCHLYSTLARTALPGGYANLLSDTAADQIAHAYGPNASRLAALKAQFDPATVLNSIPLPPKA
jgi:hypothetical protein